MKVLITGYKGFIGQGLIRHLKENSVEIVYFEGDITNKIDSDIDVDVVFHLGGVTKKEHFIKNPSLCFYTNVLGTLNVLDLCKKSRTKIIFPSSSGVYGPSQTFPISENHEANPQTIYAKSKYIAENLCESYAKSYGIDCFVLRLFNVYGRNQDSEFIVPYIIKNIIAGTAIKLTNPFSERDFIHVNDVVNAMDIAAKSKKKGFQLFNIGSGKNVKILDLAYTIEQILSSKLKMCFMNNEKDSIPASIADISKAKKELAWEPAVNIEDGLKEVINDYQ